MLTAAAFLKTIEAFITRSGMTPTSFGVHAVGDPNFVSDLREGRMPGLRLVEKVNAYIEAHAAKPNRRPAERSRARVAS